jgi:hypothetical protein
MGQSLDLKIKIVTTNQLKTYQKLATDFDKITSRSGSATKVYSKDIIMKEK